MSTLFYDDDLAYIHDVGFGSFANGVAPELIQILQDAEIDDGLIVDVGCGSGILARHLTKAGYDVLGIDVSPAMIARARAKAPPAKFQVGSLFTAKLPTCRAITALGEVVCYRADTGRDRLASWFRRATKALMPGGLLIFDVVELGVDRDRPPSFRAGPDWACLVRCEYDSRRNQLIRHITSFRKVGELYRRSEESHRVQLYQPADIATMLRKHGFEVSMVRSIGQFPLLPGRAGFIARLAD
ncbi:MAG TPA: methyltransferase domain-containing protein [Gemmataceae bacterium]|nr:methyltransferase domain-containing protein [Gemmataceae bacterium]